MLGMVDASGVRGGSCAWDPCADRWENDVPRREGWGLIRLSPEQAHARMESVVHKQYPNNTNNAGYALFPTRTKRR